MITLSTLKRALAAVVAAGISASLRAEDTVDEAAVFEMSLEELLNIPVTSASTVAERSIDAPALVSALSRQQLAAFNQWNFADVLWRQPGFSQSQLNVFRNVDNHGIHETVWNAHILLLIDGVPHNVNLTGEAQLVETPLFFARNIEVLRGPGSALYGSGAMNGVVSMHTLDAEDLKHGGEAMLRAGSWDSQSIDAVTGVAGARVSMLLGYHRLQSDGFSYPTLDASGRVDANGDLQTFPFSDAHRNDYLLFKLSGRGALEGWAFQYHQQNRSIAEGPGSFFVFPESDRKTREVEGLDTALWSYRTKSVYGLSSEHVLKWQRRSLDNDYRWFPSGTPGLPAGHNEVLKLHTDQWFLRSQWTYAFGEGATVVGGLEATRFDYDGDQTHTSNVDINFGGSFAPFDPLDPARMRALNPVLEWTVGQPVDQLAAYGQVQTGRFAAQRLSLTLGARFDRQSSRFNAIDRPRAPNGSFVQERLAFSKLSPRLALVYHGSDAFSLKALLGRAFRSPAPGESFSANTYQFGSNIRNVRPEVIDTAELVSDWQVSAALNWRVALFQSEFRDFIGFTPGFFILENIFSATTRGVETELLYADAGWSGFANASYVERVDESTEIDDFVVDADHIVWTPALTAKAGLAYSTANGVSGMLSARYQGPTRRRPGNDFLAPVTDNRPRQVAGWLSLDAKLNWTFGNQLSIEFGVNNLFDSHGGLAEIYQYPFDYRIEGRQYFIGLRYPDG